MNSTITRRSLLNGVALGGSATLLGACGDKSATTSTKPKDKVTVLTGYGLAPRETYFLAINGFGYYSGAGIEATVNAGAPSTANITALLSNKAQFAAIDWVSAVLFLRAHPGYCVVGYIQKTTLLSMITLPGRGITQPRDLNGKNIGTPPTAASRTLFPKYAELAGFTASVKWVDVNNPDDLPKDLATRVIDAGGGYAIDTPGISNAADGAKPIVFEYNKYIADLYGTVVITTRDLIRTNKDLVQRFTTATAAGLQHTVKNPHDAGAVVHSAARAVDAAITETTMGLMAQYTDASCVLDPARVMKGIALLESAGMIQSGLKPDDVCDFSVMPKAA